MGTLTLSVLPWPGHAIKCDQNRSPGPGETTNSEAGGVRELREVASMKPEKMGLGWMVIAMVAVASCGGTTQDGAAGGGGSGGLGAIGGTGAVTSGGGSSGTGAGTSAPWLCAGVECAAHEDCCLADGKCFDPKASPGACVAPSTPGPQGQKPCTASSQCAADEYCQPSNQALCLGPGYCASRTNCPSSSASSFCACNGVTYPDLQTACAAGATVIGMGPCGVPVTAGGGGSSSGKLITLCAIDAHCESGQKCCSITGVCYDASLPVLCSFPPPGSSVPCLDDSHCMDGVEYCSGAGCTGPGGCVSMPGTGSCTGEFTPVCGCNGKTYTNATCASVEGARLAHDGQCP